MMDIELLAGEVQKSENDSHIIACNDYLRMGIGRSLAKLCRMYTDPRPDEPPTKHLATLKNWSTKFNWVERAAEFDAKWDEIKSRERAASINYGLALDYERVNKLKRLADFLEAQIYEQGTEGEFHNVWVPDVKQIGRGDDAERVDIERFNSQLFSEYRAVLNDLAKETGGRIEKHDISAKIEGALNADTLAALYNQRRSARADQTREDTD